MPSTASNATFGSRIASLLSSNPPASGGVGEPCCIPGEIYFGTTPSGSDGLILGLSSRELLFREASQYLLDRKGRRVNVAFLSYQVSGTVVASQENGYRIRLTSALDPDLLAALLEEYGADPA